MIEDLLTSPLAYALLLGIGWLAARTDGDSETEKERLDRLYREDRITLQEFDRRLDVLEDPEARRIRESVEPIHGVGESLSWALAAEFDSVQDLEDASLLELESVRGVGPKTARAIQERLR